MLQMAVHFYARAPPLASPFHKTEIKMSSSTSAAQNEQHSFWISHLSEDTQKEARADAHGSRAHAKGAGAWGMAHRGQQCWSFLGLSAARSPCQKSLLAFQKLSFCKNLVGMRACLPLLAHRTHQRRF